VVVLESFGSGRPGRLAWWEGLYLDGVCVCSRSSLCSHTDDTMSNDVQSLK